MIGKVVDKIPLAGSVGRSTCLHTESRPKEILMASDARGQEVVVDMEAGTEVVVPERVDSGNTRSFLQRQQNFIQFQQRLNRRNGVDINLADQFLDLLEFGVRFKQRPSENSPWASQPASSSARSCALSLFKEVKDLVGP